MDSTARKKLKGLAKRSLSCLLTAVIVVQFMPVQAAASWLPSWFYEPFRESEQSGQTDQSDLLAGGEAQSGMVALDVTTGQVAGDDMVALEVTTGQVAGDGVVSFGIRYVDTDGFSHVEYVYPHRGDLAKSYRMAYEKGFSSQRAKSFATLGYSVEELINKVVVPLRSNQTDTYFITPTYEVREITGIEVFCAGEGSWDARGLRIYRVDSISGLDMYGYISNAFFPRYTGVMIGEMKEDGVNGDEGQTFNWVDSTIFELTADSTEYQLINHSASGTSESSGMSVSDTSSGDAITVGRRESWAEKQLRYSTEDDKRYAFTFDFADTYGAGLEVAAQSAADSSSYANADLQEAMYVELLYNDEYGDVRRVVMPVVKSVIGTMQEYGVAREFTPHGIAQQGDKVAFYATLPSFKSIEKIDLRVGKRVGDLFDVGEEESISLTSAGIYGAEQISFYTVNETTLVTETAGEPLYIFNASSYLGEQVLSGDEYSLVMLPYGDNGMPATAPVRPQENLYMVTLSATSTRLSQRPEEVFVSFRYLDVYGAKKETDPISVREAAKEFYGYWPALPADMADFCFEGLLQTEGGVQFMVELRDVDYFTGLVLSSGSTTSDWQMEHISVDRVESYGPRVCLWENISGYQGSSNRIFTREVSATPIFTMDETILVQPGESQEFDFVSNTTVQAPEYDWADIRYAMTYEQSCENLGFTKARETYTVEVEVAGNAAYTTGNGDSGSKNQFYFQLEFQDGSSGYVLANQQIGADGFRSGMKETFTVTTNQNYGDLVAVNIIPDDISEGSTNFDKLNIEKILVRRNGTGSVNRQWLVEDVGWIEIDYRDEAAGVSIGGQEGRTAAEITRTYPVTYQSYAVNLLFCIMTDEYGKSGGSGSFYGTIDGTLNYYTTTGQSKDITFNVIDLIYDYANKTPKTAMQGEKEVIVSDPNIMFRAGHTDRFILSVDDVQKINSITFNVTSIGQAGTEAESGNWNFSNISASVITSDGVLQINTNDEYQRTNATEPLATDSKASSETTYSMILPPGKTQTKRIYFTDNEVKVDIENSSWISTISREPASRNDEINAYIYPNAAASGDFFMNIAAIYTDVYGISYQTAATNINETVDENGNVLYMITGMGASGMSALNSVAVHADGPGVFEAYIDRVVIQQVRAGVVINTYTMNCMNRNASDKFFVEPGISAQDVLDEQQITFVLGEETLEAGLVPENRDIAVAIEYTSSNDPTARRYMSKYVYLTDAGHNDIAPGNTYTMTFNEPYVDEIIGVTFGATGGISAEIDMAYVATYTTVFNSEEDTGTKKMTGWYSFANGVSVNNSTAKMMPTPNNPVHPLKIQFKTAGASEVSESGTNAPIRATIGYKHVLGGVSTLEISDLRNYVTSSGNTFATGSVTDVRMLVRNMAELRSITLEPYDSNDETTQSWRLESITAVFRDDEGQTISNRTIPSDVVFAEGEELYQINLSEVSVELEASGYNRSKGAYNELRRSMSFGEEIQILIDSESWVRIDKIKVKGSDKGYTIKAEQVGEKSSATSDMSHLLTTVDGDTVTFHAPAVGGRTSQTFRISVASVEVPSVAARILVEVQPGEEISFEADFTPSSTPQNNVSQGSTGSTETGSDSTGGTESGGGSTGGTETGSGSTGGTETGGSSTGGTETGSSSTGGTETGSDSTGGTETGGDSTGGTETPPAA